MLKIFTKIQNTIEMSIEKNNIIINYMIPRATRSIVWDPLVWTVLFSEKYIRYKLLKYNKNNKNNKNVHVIQYNYSLDTCVQVAIRETSPNTNWIMTTLIIVTGFENNSA